MGLTKATEQNTTHSHRMDPERLQVLKQSIREKGRTITFPSPVSYLLVYKTLAYLHFWVKLPGPPGKTPGKQVFVGPSPMCWHGGFPYQSAQHVGAPLSMARGASTVLETPEKTQALRKAFP